MKSRVIILTLTLGLFIGLVGMTGCSDKEGNEWERLVCEVESVNEGVPLLSVYLDVGSDGISGTQDDSYPIDWVPVTFRARPYSSSITIPEDDVYSWFHVTSYDLTWIPGAAAPAQLVDYNVRGGLCDAIVPVHDEGVVAVLIADRGMKEEPWYMDLLVDVDPAYDYTGVGYTANCELTFYGHESGSDREVAIPCGLVVTFFGAAKLD